MIKQFLTLSLVIFYAYNVSLLQCQHENHAHHEAHSSSNSEDKDHSEGHVLSCLKDSKKDEDESHPLLDTPLSIINNFQFEPKFIEFEQNVHFKNQVIIERAMTRPFSRGPPTSLLFV